MTDDDRSGEHGKGAPAAERSFTYRIDDADRLTFVASEWLDFARENEATSLSSEAITGQSLFSFIGDPETRHLYRIIIDRVRQSRSGAVLPFRCDGPGVRRFMELHITPLPKGAVEFEGRLIREETREVVPLLDPSVARSDEVVVACSWCKRIDVDGIWMEVEDAVRRMGLFNRSSLPRISHGICNDCAKHFLEEFDRSPG
jgi:hypothetical protein